MYQKGERERETEMIHSIETLQATDYKEYTQNYTSHFCFALVYYGQIRVNSKQQNTSYHVNFPAYASNTHYAHPLMTTLST